MLVVVVLVFGIAAVGDAFTLIGNACQITADNNIAVSLSVFSRCSCTCCLC